MESVNSLRISAPQWWPLREGRDEKCEGRNEKFEYLARESVSSSPIVRIFGKGKCKFKSKFVPVGTIPSNQTPFFFYPTKNNMNWQLDQTKKKISIWTIIIKPSEFRWSLRVCRLKHSGHLVVKQNWQFGERQKFARSSCRGFVAQWLERPTGNRKTRVRSPAGLRCVFFVWSSCQFIFVG